MLSGPNGMFVCGGRVAVVGVVVVVFDCFVVFFYIFMYLSKFVFVF